MTGSRLSTVSTGPAAGAYEKDIILLVNLSIFNSAWRISSRSGLFLSVPESRIETVDPSQMWQSTTNVRGGQMSD